MPPVLLLGSQERIDAGAARFGHNTYISQDIEKSDSADGQRTGDCQRFPRIGNFAQNLDGHLLALRSFAHPQPPENIHNSRSPYPFVSQATSPHHLLPTAIERLTILCNCTQSSAAHWHRHTHRRHRIRRHSPAETNDETSQSLPGHHIGANQRAIKDLQRCQNCEGREFFDGLRERQSPSTR